MPIGAHRCPDDCPGWRYDAGDVAFRRDDPHSPTDEELLAAASEAGCDHSLRWWAERALLDPRYLALHARLGRRWEGTDIDNLFSEAVLVVLTKRPSPDHAAAYLERMVVNKACDDRGLGRQQSLEYRDMQHAALEGHEQMRRYDWPVSEERLQRALTACEDALSGTVRTTMHLRYSVGLSVDQTAARLGIPKGACYKRLARGRGALLDCVESRLDL